MSVTYAAEPGLSVEDYVAVLAETTMRAKRPLANRQRIAQMLAGANLIVGELNLDTIEEVRRTWQFFRDRRPDSYGILTEDR